MKNKRYSKKCMHVEVLAEEALHTVTANVTLKLQSVFKKGRMKEKLNRGREEEGGGGRQRWYLSYDVSNQRDETTFSFRATNSPILRSSF